MLKEASDEGDWEAGEEEDIGWEERDGGGGGPPEGGVESLCRGEDGGYLRGVAGHVDVNGAKLSALEISMLNIDETKACLHSRVLHHAGMPHPHPL